MHSVYNNILIILLLNITSLLVSLTVNKYQ